MLYISAIFVVITVSPFGPGSARAYVMPSEQIIGFMGKNFSVFKTIILTRLTSRDQAEGPGEDATILEKVWMQSPGFYHAQVLDPEAEKPLDLDSTYSRLLLANTPQDLLDFLHGLGIDLGTVGFTRLDGIIAYRIGDKAPGSPILLVEKDRFLPLLLVHRSPGSGQAGVVKVRFDDYRKVDERWFPFKTVYMTDDGSQWTSTVQTIEPNRPIDPAVFAPTRDHTQPSTLGGTPDSEGEERLKRIIKTFEEKYGN